MQLALFQSNGLCMRSEASLRCTGAYPAYAKLPCPVNVMVQRSVFKEHVGTLSNFTG